jgi:hypothetical protein
MKFDDIYPSVSGLFKTSDGFARGAGTPAECVVCSERTNWFHRNLALYFCSKYCFGRFQPERQHELDGT